MLPFFPIGAAENVPAPKDSTVAGAPVPGIAPEFTADDRALLAQGETIYKQLCFACHGLDGKGMPLTSGPPGATMAPPFLHDKIATGYRDGAINVVLKGLTGPAYNGKTYSAVMATEQFNSDLWIASVLSYVRTSFGNSASIIETNDVAAVREAFTNREAPWTTTELLSSLPQPLTNRAKWKLRANHNSATAGRAIETNVTAQYDTKVAQSPGVWFQIQLPAVETIAGLEFNSGSSPDDFPRGYQVQLSGNGRQWSAPVATGRGTGTQTEIIFPTERARYIRITLTAAAPHFWTIHDLQILGPAPPPPSTPVLQKTEPSKFD